MAPLDACPLCTTPNVKIDVALMLHGPEVAAHSQKLIMDGASPASLFFNHWHHLNEKMLVPKELPPPPLLDADPLDKTRWTQYALFRLTFGAEDITSPLPEDQIQLVRVKKGSLDSLLSSIRLEADLLGHTEKAKIKGKRRAERELATEESEQEKLMSHEEQLKMYANALRLYGYDVSKIVNAETLDGKE